MGEDELKAEHIKQIACEAAEKVLNTAAVAAASLNATVAANIENIKADISDIKTSLASNFVSREAFEPIRNIVYGLVSIILVAVCGALVALVVVR